MERIEELNNKWRQYVDARNAYLYGDEKINLVDFAELVKETFEVIKSAKENYIYKNTMPDDPVVALDFLRLVSTISQYTLYDNAEDESEDRIFSVTCIVAHALVNFAIFFESVLISNGKSTLAMTEEKASGVLHIDPEAFWIRKDAKLTKHIYEYNIYKADFSELFELAKALL